MDELPDDIELSNEECETALIRLAEAIERGGCPLGMIYVRDHDPGGMTIVAHYSNARTRALLSATPPAPVEQDVERVARALMAYRGCPVPNGTAVADVQFGKIALGDAEAMFAALSTLTPARAEGFKAGVEAAAKMADAERDYRALCEANATIKGEKRDFQTMKIAAVQIASAIRAIHSPEADPRPTESEVRNG